MPESRHSKYRAPSLNTWQTVVFDFSRLRVPLRHGSVQRVSLSRFQATRYIFTSIPTLPRLSVVLIFRKLRWQSPAKATSSMIKLLKSVSLRRLFRMGRLSIYLIWYLLFIFMIFFNLTLHTLYGSTMLLSIVYFAWGRAIIYMIIWDTEAFLKRKEKYIFLFIFFFYFFLKKELSREIFTCL